MTPKSSEQNLKSTRLAIRIQSILSSAHGDLITSFAPFIPQAVYFLLFSVLSVLFVCSYVFLCVCSLFFISRPDHRLKSRSAGASEFLWFFAFP